MRIRAEGPRQFTRLLDDHARVIRERIERQVSQDRLIFDSYDFVDAPSYDLPRDLLPVVEENFFEAVEGEPDLYQLSEDSFAILAGMPLAPFVEAMMCWAFARSLKGGCDVPGRDFGFVIQHNRIDWFETRAALLAAAACFAHDDASRTGRWALVSILRATGNADDGIC